MSEFYDRQGRPITLREWGKLREDRKGPEARVRVGLDIIGEAEVSTVWLGMDHGWGQGPPLIFETMIFGGPHDQWQDRYSTEEAATAGHRAVVEALRNGTPLPGEETP